MKFAPVNSAALGLVSVKVTVLVAPGAIGFGKNALAMVGAAKFTVKVSLPPVALAGASVVASTEVVFNPLAVAVTSTVTVQLALAGISAAVRLKVPPAASALWVIPAHVPPTTNGVVLTMVAG